MPRHRRLHIESLGSDLNNRNTVRHRAHRVFCSHADYHAVMAPTAENCIFCNPAREIITENASAIAVFDNFPVSPGHVLILPRRHVETVWELTDVEYEQCFRLVRTLHPILMKRFSPDGFNVGLNCGEAAGQSVWHAHIHVIPRYKGDVPNPRGGVRHVIPLKGNY